MIDTSIVRVHQHGACITRKQRQSMGRSRGELTSKIVDSNGLPVRLALSPGEAHDNRLAGKLLFRLKSESMLLADRGYDADWIRELAMKKGRRMGQHPAEKKSQQSNLLQPLSLPRPEQGRAVLQSDRAVSSGGRHTKRTCQSHADVRFRGPKRPLMRASRSDQTKLYSYFNSIRVRSFILNGAPCSFSAVDKLQLYNAICKPGRSGCRF